MKRALSSTDPLGRKKRNFMMGQPSLASVQRKPLFNPLTQALIMPTNEEYWLCLAVYIQMRQRKCTSEVTRLAVCMSASRGASHLQSPLTGSKRNLNAKAFLYRL